MARTLQKAESSSVLRDNAGRRFDVDGQRYQFARSADRPAFTLLSKDVPIVTLIDWAVGSGAISQVFLTAGTGTYTESHFSYFNGTKGFDVTPAQPTQVETAHTAVGRKVSLIEVRRCFSCHAANVPASGPITDPIIGVTCEACHGPGRDHVAAERAGLDGAESLILNPDRLSPAARVDFCGACHITSVDAQLMGASGFASIRFPAYRLENSRCWRNDARIQCTACHDPHTSLVRNSSFYDQKCLACHLLTLSDKADDSHPGHACPAATHNCVNCHMPKFDFPDVHAKFTDHQIRIVRSQAPLPQ